MLGFSTSASLSQTNSLWFLVVRCVSLSGRVFAEKTEKRESKIFDVQQKRQALPDCFVMCLPLCVGF